MMISKYVKEQKKYSLNELEIKFKTPKEELLPILKRLREVGVLKVIKKKDDQINKNELLEEELLLEFNQDYNNSLFVFKFVGIIVVSNYVFKCLPKYINITNKNKAFKKILKVLKKYNSDKQSVSIYDDIESGENFNLLATILSFMNDYYENGLYQTEETIYEVNGDGMINWDKTINHTFTIINNNRPIYPEVITKRKQLDYLNYYRRLHQYLLTKCSQILEEAELLEYFDYTPIYESAESIDEFGDKDYILYQLEKEINIQFNTRLQYVLKLMYLMISGNISFRNSDKVNIYGTSNFENVWEKICQVILDNDLNKPLTVLNLPNKLQNKYKKRGKTLLEIVEKPKWNIKTAPNKTKTISAARSFIPDCIKIDTEFKIIDAKYYVPNFDKENKISDQPGIADVSKQFIYQLVYQDFVESHGISNISNYFILPSEKFQDKRMYISMNLFNKLGLSNIEVIFLEVNVAYDAYLEGRHINIKL